MRGRTAAQPAGLTGGRTRVEVDQWLPIHDWTLEEVWADIRAGRERESPIKGMLLSGS